MRRIFVCSKSALLRWVTKCSVRGWAVHVELLFKMIYIVYLSVFFYHMKYPDKKCNIFKSYYQLQTKTWKEGRFWRLRRRRDDATGMFPKKNGMWISEWGPLASLYAQVMNMTVVKEVGNFWITWTFVSLCWNGVNVIPLMSHTGETGLVEYRSVKVSYCTRRGVKFWLILNRWKRRA